MNRKMTWRLGSCALLSVVGLLHCAPALAQFKVNATFRNATEPGWTITGTNNTGNNDSGILTGGYGAIADGKGTNDAAGSGFLRLTTVLNAQVGAALYTGGSFPSLQGVVVDFNYDIWGGTGADGISFFLYDAAQNMAGAQGGGSLGYCYGAGAYLGVGLDEFGNFSGQLPGVTGGCPSTSGSPGSASQRIVIRGPAANNYVFVANAAVPGNIDVPAALTRPASDKARILLIPNGSGGYRVTAALSQGGGAYATVINAVNFPYVAPSALRMGFSGGTGGLNNVHEIYGVVTSTPADVRVTKTVGAAAYFPGQAVNYTMTVTNADINATDAGNQAPTIDAANAPDIADAMPASLSGVTWTCSATAGSTCPAASGSGNIAATGGYTLAPGGVLTYTITGTLATTATCSSTVTNTATADFSSTDGFSDLNTADNTASASFTVSCADLSVTKTDGVTQYTPGQALTYTVVARNTGPSAVTNAVFKDPAVANFTASAVTCGSATGGATCPTVANTTVALMQGGGIVIPSLPSGGSVTFTITGTAAVAATGNLVNTATIAMPGGLTDTNSANNTATDTDGKAPILRLQKALPLGRFVASDQFTLTITGTGGPAAVTTTGSGTTATGVATLNPGTAGSAYTFSETAASGNLSNYTSTWSCTNALSGGQTPSGSGTSFSITPVFGDDLTCTLSNVRNPLADLRLTKTNTAGVNGEVDQSGDTVTSGSATTYTVTVTNLGPDPANGAVVKDPAPTGLTCATASCTAAGGATCPAQTGAALVSALQGAGATVPALPVGGIVTITLSCQVL